jgi:anti-anti-sigma factor
MTDIRIEKEEARTVIVMSGEMTVEHAAGLKDALIRSLEDADHLIVDLRDVTDMDVSCLQLLCSAHRTFAGARKTLEIKSDYPETLKETVREVGYSRDCGCTTETENGCLWKRI